MILKTLAIERSCVPGKKQHVPLKVSLKKRPKSKKIEKYLFKLD